MQALAERDLVRDEGVVGSNPIAPTNTYPGSRPGSAQAPAQARFSWAWRWAAREDGGHHTEYMIFDRLRGSNEVIAVAYELTFANLIVDSMNAAEGWRR